MNSMTTTRMLLSTAALAAVAALFAGGANAVAQDDGGGASYNQPIVGGDFVHAALANRTAVTTVPGTIPYLSQGIGVDESQFSGQPSLGPTGDSALKVDQAVAAANKAYDTYREKTAIAARQALFTDQHPSVGLTGDSAVTRYPATVTLPTASSASDVDWSSFGLGAGMSALLAAAVAGVVLTTRRRGGIALP